MHQQRGGGLRQHNYPQGPQRTITTSSLRRICSDPVGPLQRLVSKPRGSIARATIGWLRLALIASYLFGLLPTVTFSVGNTRCVYHVRSLAVSPHFRDHLATLCNYNSPIDSISSKTLCRPVVVCKGHCIRHVTQAEPAPELCADGFAVSSTESKRVCLRLSSPSRLRQYTFSLLQKYEVCRRRRQSLIRPGWNDAAVLSFKAQSTYTSRTSIEASRAFLSSCLSK